MPSFGATIIDSGIYYNNPFQLYGYNKGTSFSDVCNGKIFSFPDEYFSGFGLYADYISKKYYWYFASYTPEWDGGQLKIEFLTMNGVKEKPVSLPKISASLSSVNNDSGISLNENGECYVYLSMGPKYLSAITANYDDDIVDIRGASLGFWLFDNYLDSYTCFMEGTKVLMADGSVKNIENVKVHDVIKFMTNEGEIKTTEVVLPPEEYAGLTKEYYKYTFSDNTSVNIYGKQRIWNEDNKDYTFIDTWDIGVRTKKINGKVITLTKKEKITLETEKKHYFLQTWCGNYTVNDLLTYTSQYTIWQNLSKEENRQYWRSSDEMKKQKRKILDRHYKGTPMAFSKFRETLMDLQKEKSKLEANINKNKKYLNDTDYVAIKHAEDEISNEEYLPIKAKRIEARAAINEFEEAIVANLKELDAMRLKIEAKKNLPRDSTQSGDSLVLMSDGTQKMLKDIKAGDVVMYLNTDNMLETSRVMLPAEPELVWDYTLIALENGTELKLSGMRLIFNATKGTYCHQRACDVNDELLLSDGTTAKIISKETVTLDDPEEFYRLNTYYAQYILNGVSLKTGTMRNYEELMYDEHAFWRLSDSEMATWKKWCEDNKDV